VVASAGIGGLLGTLLASLLLKRVGVGPIIIAMAEIFILFWPL
jgi:hypothetical protein